MNELIALTMTFLKTTTDPSSDDDDAMEALEALQAHMASAGNRPEQVEHWTGYVLELADEEDPLAAVVADVAIAGAAGWIKV